MKAIIDTCVIIDALQAREPFCKVAQKLLISAAEEKFEGLITANSISDIYYLSHKLLHNSSETKKILNKLFSFLQIVDTTGEDCIRAVSSPVMDYEDAIMVEGARRTEADCIITGNIKDFAYSQVKVYKPAEFLEFLKSC